MEPDSFVPDPEVDAPADQADRPAPRARAPNDERPYDDNEDATFCFASAYAPSDTVSATDLGGGELKDAFRQMHAIIDRHFGNNTSMTDLVEAVHQFYETKIRKAFDYGPWSRKSIYRYVMQHSTNAEDHQASEAIRLLWNNIEFMRENVARVNEETGESTPDLRMVKALSEAVKLHSGLINDRRKRPRVAA